MKFLKYIIPISLVLFIAVTTYAISVFHSNQVGTTPTNGYVLQTNGTDSTWVSTSTLGFYWTKTFWAASNTPTTIFGKSFGSGTTTISIMGFPTAVTLTRLACQTDLGTVNVILGNGSASSTSLNVGTSGASTTPSITLAPDQSFFVNASSSNPTGDGLRCTIKAN